MSSDKNAVPFLKAPNFKAYPTSHQRADLFLRSEARYVDSLRVLHDIYNRLICSEQLDQPILSKDEISALFLNLDSIYKFSSGFLTELNDIRWEGVDTFLEQFPRRLGKAIPFLKLYASYNLNCKSALANLKSWFVDKKKLDFKNFVMLNEMVYAKGMDVLITAPLNRLPQYLRYAAAIYETLPAESVSLTNEYAALVMQLQQVMDQISERAENQIRRSRVVAIQESVFKGKAVLVAPTRKFFRSGILKLREGAKFKEYNFYLFNDLLMYADSGMFSGLVIKGVMQLSGAKITPLQSLSHAVRVTSGFHASRDWELQVVADGKDPVDKTYVKWLIDLHDAYVDHHGASGSELNVSALHPDDFEATIKKVDVMSPRTMPRPPRQSLDDLVQLIGKLHPAWAKKQAVATAAAAAVPSVPPKRTPLSPVTGTPGVPTRRAPPTPVAVRPVLPPKPPTTPSATPSVATHPHPPQPPAAPHAACAAVVVSLEELPAVVGDWERLVDPDSQAYYYENLIQDVTVWDAPDAVVAYQQACTTAKRAGRPFPPPPPASVSALPPVPEVTTGAAPAPAAGSPPPPPVIDMSAPPVPVLDFAPSGSSNASSGAARPADLLSAIRGGASLRKTEPASSPSSNAGNNDLLSAIRGGASLRKVDPEELKASAPSPTNSLLSAIQGGVQLRKVDPSEKVAAAPTQALGIAGALQKSLANYRKFVQDDSDNDDEDDW